MNSLKASSDSPSVQPSATKPELNYYKVLDVRETADRMEIRESYVRLKKTFSGQNQALYSLVSPEESGKALAQVEEAFRVLDDEYQREAYDRRLFGVQTPPKVNANPQPAKTEHGAFSAGEPFTSQISASTAFDQTDPFGGASPNSAASFEPLTTDAISDTMRGLKSTSRLVTDWSQEGGNQAFEPKHYPPIEKVAKRAQQEQYISQIRELVDRSDIGSGLLYREIRELLEVSRSEIQNKTKVSPEYVIAIEENAFHILPAAVYVKGFVKSYLEYLGVENVESIASAFVERFKKWQAAEKT